MKFTFSLALLAVVLAVAFAEIPEKLKTAREQCNADPATKNDQAAVDRIRAGTGTDEDKLVGGKHELCVNVKMGNLMPNGDYVIENIRKSLETKGLDKTQIDEVIAKCGTRPEGSTAAKAAGLLTQCIHEYLHKK